MGEGGAWVAESVYVIVTIHESKGDNLSQTEYDVFTLLVTRRKAKWDNFRARLVVAKTLHMNTAWQW